MVGSSLPASASSAINTTMNFQGRLLTAAGAVVPDGNYNMEFKIYAGGPGNVAGDTGGTLLWTEDWLNFNSNEGVVVKNGYYSIQLGSLTSLPSSVNLDQGVLWLSMTVANGNSPNGATSTTCTTFSGCNSLTEPEMLPMKELSATPFALNSASTNQVNSYGLSNSFMDLAAPSGITAVNGAAGVVPGTVCYAVTATDASGETIAASNSGTVTPGWTHVVTVSWTAVNGATGYKIYRNSSCSFTSGSLLDATITSGQTVTYSDNASSTSAGLPPTTVTGTTVTLQAWNTQTGNLLQAENSAGSNIDTIDASGNLKVAAGDGLDTLAGGGLTIGGTSSTTNATQINIGNTGSTTTQVIDIGQEANTSGTESVNIGTAAASGGADAVGIGSMQGSSATTIAGGTTSSAVLVEGGSGGSITIGNQASSSANTINVGNTTAAITNSDNVNVDTSTGANTGVITLGGTGMGISNTITGSATTPSDAITAYTGSAGTFQVQGPVAGGYTNNIFDINTAPAGTNLINNSGFENSGTNGYTDSAAGIAVTNSPSLVYSGHAALALPTLTSAGTTTYTITAANLNGATGSLPGSSTYYLSFWAMAGSGNITLASPTFVGPGTTCTLNSTTVSTTGYQHYTCSAATGATATTSITMTTTTINATLYIDGVELTKTTSTPGQDYEPGNVELDGLVTSPVTIQTGANTTGALQIQNASGQAVLTADTINSQVVLGVPSALGGKLTFSDSANADQISVVSGETSGSYTLTIPNITGADTICTNGTQATACANYAAASGDNNYIENQSASAQTANYWIQGSAQIAPTGNTVTALTVTGTTGTAATAFALNQGGTADAEDIAVSNSSSTATNALSVTKTNGGVLTNAFNITATAGITNGININGSGVHDRRCAV